MSRTRVLLAAAGFALALVASLAGGAHAGGVAVGLTVSNGTIWASYERSLVTLDARSARVTRRFRAALPYPIAVAGSGGTVCVASVTNGFRRSAVELFRPPARRPVATRTWRRPLYGLSEHGGSCYALLGPRSRPSVVELTATDPPRPVAVPADTQRIAGSPGGLLVTTPRGLHLAGRSGLRLVAAEAGLDLLAASGSTVWASAGARLLRFDKRNPVPRTAVPLPALPAALALDGRDLYVVTVGEPTWTLSHLDADTGRLLRSVGIERAATALALTSDAIWVGVSGDGPRLLKLDRRSLRRLNREFLAP